MAVPEVCKECYEQCMVKAVEVYQLKLNNDGDALVQKARSQWLAKRDYASANEALSTLGDVDPQSLAQTEAQKLIAEINHHLRGVEAARAKAAKEAAEKAEAKEQRDWDFKVKQYEYNMAMARQRQTDNTVIQREYIAAAREVGVAYAKHQTKSVTYNNIRVW